MGSLFGSTFSNLLLQLVAYLMKKAFGLSFVYAKMVKRDSSKLKKDKQSNQWKRILLPFRGGHVFISLPLSLIHLVLPSLFLPSLSLRDNFFYAHMMMSMMMMMNRERAEPPPSLST